MPRTHSRHVAVAALGSLVLTWGGHPAQLNLGPNQDQDRFWIFRFRRSEHFDIYFYPSERAGVEIAARMAERWQPPQRLLRHELRGRQPLMLYGSHVDFEQTNVIGGEIGEGTGGVTESLRRASCCRSPVRWPTPIT